MTNTRLAVFFRASAILSCLTLSACLNVQLPNPEETQAPAPATAPTPEPTTQPPADPTPPPSPTTLPANVFFDDFNGASIDASVWTIATWTEHGGKTGTERCFAKDGNLNMRFINNGGTFLSSGIETKATFLYGRWEYRAKCSSVPGVLNSFYTIDWDSGAGTKQEIDIEFLTKTFNGNSGQVSCAVHEQGKANPITGNDANVDLGFNPSAGFHTYGLDIGPTRIQWLADGNVIKTYDYSDGEVSIDRAYTLKLNFWSSSTGSAGAWIGGPPASGVMCEYLIDWIKFTPAE